MNVSSTVTGSRSQRTVVTGRPYLMEVPKSPLARLPR